METIKLPLFVAVLALFLAFAAAAKPDKPTAALVGGGTTADAGEIKIKCTKGAAGSVPSTWKFYNAASAGDLQTGNANGIDTLTQEKGAGTFPYACTGLDNAATPLESDRSTLISIVVAAILAPKLTSAPAAKDGKLSAACNSKVVFTCAKDAANKDPTKYSFMVDGKDAGEAGEANPYTRTLTQADDGKKVKCTFYNTATAKLDSNEITLTVTGCPTSSSDAVTHVVSLTTMGLFLVLGAIFRE